MNNDMLKMILREQPEEWEDLHVTPLDDLLPHSDGADCICDPSVEIHGSKLLIIHNAFDGRG